MTIDPLFGLAVQDAEFQEVEPRHDELGTCYRIKLIQPVVHRTSGILKSLMSIDSLSVRIQSHRQYWKRHCSCRESALIFCRLPQ